MSKNMSKLHKIAAELDRMGLYSVADQVDLVISKLAAGQTLPDAPNEHALIEAEGREGLEKALEPGAEPRNVAHSNYAERTRQVQNALGIPATGLWDRTTQQAVEALGIQKDDFKGTTGLINLIREKTKSPRLPT